MILVILKKWGQCLETITKVIIPYGFLLISVLFHTWISLADPLQSAIGTAQNSPQELDFPPPLDLDRGIVRSLNIEESWVENALYLHSVNADNLSRGNMWTLSGEMDFALNDWLGGELDFPVLLMTYPLGQAPSGFGPITLGLRIVPFQTGTEVSREAAILSMEVEGNLWPTPQTLNFPGQGNSVTPELLWAYRYHRVFFQGITGYTIPEGIGAIANPFFEISVGRTFEQTIALQIEADANGAIPLSIGRVAPTLTFIPEVAYMPYGDLWLNEIGEGLTIYGSLGPQPTTYFMMEFELGLILGG